MKCLSACFTAIAPLKVMVLLTMGGLIGASGILHSAMQEQFSSNATGQIIFGNLDDDGGAEFFAGVEFSRVSLSAFSPSVDERFLTLEGGEHPGWIIQSYSSPFDGNQYARDSVNDLPIRRVADVSSDKLEMTPAVYQFTLESSGESPKLHARESTTRFSF